jgi:hypothetical protein
MKPIARRGLLGTASALATASLFTKPVQAAAEFDFKLGVIRPITIP